MSTAKSVFVAMVLVALMLYNVLFGSYETNLVLAPLLGGLLVLHRRAAGEPQEVEPSAEFVAPNLHGPLKSSSGRCTHERRVPVYVEFFPGVPTLVSRVCRQCGAAGWTEGRATGWLPAVETADA